MTSYLGSSGSSSIIAVGKPGTRIERSVASSSRRRSRCCRCRRGGICRRPDSRPARLRALPPSPRAGGSRPPTCLTIRVCSAPIWDRGSCASRLTARPSRVQIEGGTCNLRTHAVPRRARLSARLRLLDQLRRKSGLYLHAKPGTGGDSVSVVEAAGRRPPRLRVRGFALMESFHWNCHRAPIV